MSNIESSDRELNALIQAGKALETFDRFYADDVEMQENLGVATKGRAVNLEREQGMWAPTTTIHKIELLSSAVSGDTSLSEWLFDVTLGNGYHIQMTEVSRRKWKDGKVVHERFYYDPKASA